MKDKPILYVDFNGMVTQEIVLLSSNDFMHERNGKEVELYEGLEITIYMDDIDENGTKYLLMSEGIVMLNTYNDWSKNVKWCCKITNNLPDNYEL